MTTEHAQQRQRHQGDDAGAAGLPRPTGGSGGKVAAAAESAGPSGGSSGNHLTEPLLPADHGSSDEVAPAASAGKVVSHQHQRQQQQPLAPAVAQGVPLLATAPLPPPPRPSRRRVAQVLCGTTLCLATLFLCQVFSLLFTAAWLSQMVFLLAPLMVALMARALFRSPLPAGLWPALALMLLGCTLVIGSKAMAMSGSGDDGGGSDADMAAMAAASLGAWPVSTAVSSSNGGGGSSVIGGGGGGGASGPLGWSSPGFLELHRHHPEPRPAPSGGFGLSDVLGILLSLLGAFALASFMILAQVGAVGGTGTGKGGVSLLLAPSVMSLDLIPPALPPPPPAPGAPCSTRKAS